MHEQLQHSEGTAIHQGQYTSALGRQTVRLFENTLEGSDNSFDHHTARHASHDLLPPLNTDFYLDFEPYKTTNSNPPNSKGPKTVFAEHSEGAVESLERDIEKLRQLSPSQRDIMMHAGTIPPVLKEAYLGAVRGVANDKDGYRDFISWLVRDPKLRDGTEDESSRRIRDAQVVNYLQWSNYFVNDKNTDPKIQEDIYLQRQAIANMAEAAEWLSETEKEQVIKTVSSIPILVGDSFNTTADYSAAYYDPGLHEIVLAPATKLGSEATIADARLPHEIGHATFEGYKDYTWLDEAFAEHFGLALKDGNVLEAHPDRRTNKGVYVEQRILGLVTLLNRGKQRIQITDGLRAWMSPRDSHDRKQFEARLDASWETTDVLGRVDTAIKRGLEETENMTEVEKQEFVIRLVTQQLVHGKI